MTKLALLCAVLAIGCGGKKKSAESCGALTVTVDGAPLTAMPNGVARFNDAAGMKNYEVQVFNHDKTTCEAFLDKKGRQVPEGEVSVRAFAGGDGMMGKGVGIDSHTQAGGEVSLVTDKPKAVGDTVSICVDNVTFSPNIGDLKGKKVVVKGLLSGKYCGEMKF